MAEELARRVAAAIENARLHRDVQEAVRVREALDNLRKAVSPPDA